MADDISDLFTTTRQQADDLRNVGVYNQQAGYQQAINQTTSSTRLSADLAQTQEKLLIDINAEQERLIKQKYSMDASALDYKATVLNKLHASNSGLEEVRQQGVSEVTDDVQRMQQLEEDRPKFLHNPIGNVINKLRAGALKEEITKDIQRTNLVTGVINQNYQTADLSLKEYQSTVYMRNAQLLHKDAQLSANKLKLRQQRIGLVDRQNVTNQKAAAYIASATRNYEADTGVKQTDLSNPVYLAMQTLSGDKGPLTPAKVQGFQFILASTPPEQRTLFSRSVYESMQGNGELDQQDLVAAIAQNGTVDELSAALNFTGNRELQYSVAAARSAYMDTALAGAKAKYAAANGFSDVAALNTALSADSGEATKFKQYFAAGIAKDGEMPASSFLEKGNKAILATGYNSFSPDGSDITATSLTRDTEVIQRVLPEAVAFTDFMTLVASEDFRTGMTGSTSPKNGLSDKVVFMTQQFQEKLDIPEGVAAEIASKLITEQRKGQLVNEYPELVQLQRLRGTPLEIELTNTVSSSGLMSLGGESREFNLADPVDVLSIKARRDRENYQRARIQRQWFSPAPGMQ